MSQNWKYFLTAGALGLGWFVVLLIPSITREWLLENSFQNLLYLIIASVLTALIGRKYIDRAENLGGYFWRAVLMPYLGCILFLTIWNLIFWTKTLIFGGLANAHDTWSLYVMGLTAVTFSLYVVVPYGFFCQYTMQKISFSN